LVIANFLKKQSILVTFLQFRIFLHLKSFKYKKIPIKKPVVSWTKPVVSWTKPVVSWTKPVVSWTKPVVSWTI